MKKNFLGFILLGLILLSVFALFFSVTHNTQINTEAEETETKTETKPESKAETKTETVSESAPPTKKPSTSSPTSDNNSSVFARVFGEWLIIDTIGSGYIFSSSYPEEDYIGGKIIIRDELVQCSLPNEKWNYTVKNPKFVMQWQSAGDFFIERYAKYESFGFEDAEKVPLIEIKKKKKNAGLLSRLWIKDEDHIVIFGPEYYLAERQKD